MNSSRQCVDSFHETETVFTKLSVGDELIKQDHIAVATANREKTFLLISKANECYSDL